MKFLKFLMVNGRTPRLASTCAWCCEPIGEAYLREVPTRLPYCDHGCYFAHQQSLEDFHVAKADEAGKAAQTGDNVSHSNRKTKRRRPPR